MTHLSLLLKVAILSAGTAALGGCGASEYLGLDDDLPKRPIVYDQPVHNGADRREPFVQRLRYPIPDTAWEEENGSETEPWTVRR